MSERTEAEFSTLREANVHRQSLWDSGNQITLAYRGNEMAGEVGEACNVIKKIERERLGIRGSRATLEQLAEELADVVICADLIAMGEGIDLLGKAVPDKFNATSEKVGLPTRLAREVLSRHPEPPTGGDVLPDCMMPDGADPCLGYRQQADTIARLRERVAELERSGSFTSELLEQVRGERAILVAELSSLKAAGTRADGIEAAAKVHEPSCSCPHPCDDYFIWPSPCHKKAAAVIRALSTAPDAKSVVEEKQELSPSNPLGDAIERGDHSTATPVSPPGGGT